MLYIPHPWKRCSKCGAYKPFANFSPRSFRKATDGLNHQCKECNSDQTSRWRDANRVEVLAAHRIQQRIYRAQNPEKVKSSKHRYYLAHREQILAHHKQYVARNSEKVRIRRKKHRELNKDKIRQKMQSWCKANPEERRTARKRRQMQKRNLHATLTGLEWSIALRYWNGVCAYCGNGPSLFDQSQTLQQDHYIPVSKGGAYTRNNIIPACQSCNYSKKDRSPEEWIVQSFGKRNGKDILKRIHSYFEWIKGQ